MTRNLMTATIAAVLAIGAAAVQAQDNTATTDGQTVAMPAAPKGAYQDKEWAENYPFPRSFGLSSDGGSR